MNILQRIAALCGRDYVLMKLPVLNNAHYYIMPIAWFDSEPFARYGKTYNIVMIGGTHFLTPRIKQWAQAQETTRRLEGEPQSVQSGLIPNTVRFVGNTMAPWKANDDN